MNRRHFIASAAASTLAARYAWAAADHSLGPVGVQLYSVRDLMKSDFDGTIAKVAAIGYKQVEFAGYFDKKPKDIRATLDKNNLTSPSCHIPYEVVANSLPEQIEASKIIGHKLIINPWIDEKQRASSDGWKRAAELFNKAGAMCAKSGIQFGYHNHTFEFQPSASLNGQLPYDFLLANCDPKLVKMELDLCWISVAGKDPLEYFAKYPGRFPAVHVKDMKQLPKGAEGPTASPDKEMPNMTEVGKGVIDWKRILPAAKKAGVQYFFVEHDNPANPLESIKTSFEYLNAFRY